MASKKAAPLPAAVPKGTSTAPAPVGVPGTPVVLQAVLQTREGAPYAIIAPDPSVLKAYSLRYEGRVYEHTDTDEYGRWIYREAT